MQNTIPRAETKLAFNLYSRFEHILLVVVVAQVTEKLLLTLEIRGSNTVIGAFYRTFIYCPMY